MKPALVLGCLTAASIAFAEGDDVRDLSLEALLDTPVEVATREARSIRATPGVVLVVTREEMLAAGARDLLEVLQLVPGFTFHTDVEGVIGAGFRGVWGHEGKVLLMLDGQELNELLYSSTQFGHHLLTHDIERVEVIRGPGSSVYGGSAELAVINVISRSAAQIGRAEGAVRASTSLSGAQEGSASASGGWHDDQTDLKLNVSFGKAIGSNGEFVDFSGGRRVLGEGSREVPMLINAGIKVKDLKVRLIYDDYAVGAAVGYGTLLSTDEQMRFRTFIADAQYDVTLSDTVKLKPRLNVRMQSPWQNTTETSEIFYTKTALRTLAGLQLAWQATQSLDVMAGIEGTFDYAWLNDPRLIGSQSNFGGENTVSYGNGAAWAQVLWDTSLANIAAGVRGEFHSQYGPNVAPRLALTRQLGMVNLKLLGAGAFRSPGIENINLAASNLRPERTWVAEAEVGVQASDVLYVSANGFYTAITSPIVYRYAQETMSESYVNAGYISTAGAEAIAVLRGRHGFLNASYSLAVPVTSDVTEYGVPGQPGRFLGMPLHKATLHGKWRVVRGFSLGGSAVFLSDRFAWTPSDLLDGTGVIGRIPEGLNLSANVAYENAGIEGLTIQLGMSNILGLQMPYVQPYDGGMAPIPGRGRELFVRLSFQVPERR